MKILRPGEFATRILGRDSVGKATHATCALGVSRERRRVIVEINELTTLRTLGHRFVRFDKVLEILGDVQECDHVHKRLKGIPGSRCAKCNRSFEEGES